MQHKSRAFTLIELLVVVLIIGILAAVAVPQYQKAVDKTRFMTYIQVAFGIKRAQETYYLANNEYATDLTTLDVGYAGNCTFVTDSKNTLTCPNGFYMDNTPQHEGEPPSQILVMLCPGHNSMWSECNSNKDALVSIYYEHSSRPNKVSCSGSTTRGEAICKSLQGMF